MKKMKLPVTKEQMEFLKSLGVEDREYTVDEIEDKIISEALICHLTAHGFKDNEYSETNEIGDMCENIIDTLSKQIYE